MEGVEKMARYEEKAKKGIRAVSILITVSTLISLAENFFVSLIFCLLLIWKHTAWRIAVPLVEDRESAVIAWCCFGIVIMAVYGMRKRLQAVFRGKTWKWYAVLTLPLFVVEVVIYVANWGAGYGILYRSGGNMGLYYDQIFSYAGWVVLSGLSLFAVGVYVLSMDRIYMEQKKNSQYHEQVAVYQMLEEQYRQSERLRHDLKNHVLALRSLWEEQDWEKLGDYLKRMEGSAQLGMNEEATGSRPVDALLCQKRKMAEEKGILWECSVQMPKSCKIDDFDWCVLFGNILDNAVEACDQLRSKKLRQELQPFIRIHAGTVKKCFLLEVSNSTEASARPEIGYTEKENSQGHGIGLLNVEDMVNRYSGAMNVEIENGVFVISVLLPMGDAVHDIERAV